jgi:hypothetical protein
MLCDAIRCDTTPSNLVFHVIHRQRDPISRGPFLVFGLWSLVLGPGDLPQQYGYCTVVICSYLLTYLLSMDDRRNGTLPRG